MQKSRVLWTLSYQRQETTWGLFFLGLQVLARNVYHSLDTF